MGKKFKNINEELERMKTLMYETDNLILNNEKTIINESVETQEESDSMDEQDTDFKTKRSSFKVAKVSDINTLVRGGASKFDTYKIKGTGVTQLFDDKGKMTPEGMELMKKSGLNLPAGQVVMRIGKRDDADTDKVFFQVVPATELSIVTKDQQIADLTAQDLDKLATEKTKVVPAPTPSPKQEPTPTPSGKIPSDKELLYSQYSKFEKVLDTVDGTKNFNSAGYTKFVGATYKINKVNGDVYRVTKDGVISAIFKKKGKELTKENFNLDLVFVNPMLFESVILEQTTGKNYEYQCVGDCSGQNIMSTKFTDVVDDTLAGKEWKGEVQPTPSPTPSPVKEGGDWSNFPCITSNPAIKKIEDPKFGVIYQDAANKYFANGRFLDIKAGKMGNYKCEGNKIVSDKQQTAETPKYKIVTDSDLIGDTGRLRQYIQQVTDLGGGMATILDTLGINIANLAAGRRLGVKGVVDALDGFVDSKDLAYVLQVIKSLNNVYYFDEETESYTNATTRFLEVYSEDEGGDNLITDVESVGTTTLPTGAEKLKKVIVATINKQKDQEVPADLQKSGESNVS
jgi:hypothetical protein